MGRTVKTTETTKAVITNNVSTTLTSVYTNTTGVGADLKAVNINGVGNSAVFNTATGSSEWTFFGSNVNPYLQASAASGTGFGIPYPVQLSDNRVLIFFLPHFQHRGGTFDFMGGNTIHTQILEYQTNKYVAGPIVNVALPTAAYNSATYSLWSQPNNMSGSYAQGNFRAIALSSTKVVAAYRIGTAFRLMRFTISGNSVSHTTADLDLTGATYFNSTTAGAYDLAIVPGNPNKVVVGGYATTNWALQAFNIPDSGALSSASALTSTGIAVSAYHFDICNMVKTATAGITPYIIAAATSATAGSAVIFNFNDSLNTFTVSGTAQNLPAASSAWSGIAAACLSTGTGVNAVIAFTATGTPNTISFCRQTSSAGASVTTTTLTLQHSAVRSLTEKYQWGDERVVLIGDTSTLVCYDSSGVATNLLPATETTNTERIQQMWFPFNSRPLYNLNDVASVFAERNHQWMSRTNVVGTTGVGVPNMRGNYFPYGHNYGGGYAWSEPADCWIIGQNGRLYAVDKTGVVQSEIAIYDYSTLLNWQYRVSQVGVTPSGKILFSCEYRIGVWGGGNYNCWNTWNNFSDSMYTSTTESVTAAVDLGKSKLLAGPTNTSGFIAMSLTPFIEEIGATGSPLVRTERAYLFNMYNPGGNNQGYIWQWNGSTNAWTAVTTISLASTTTGQSWMTGWRIPYKLMQDTPASGTYTVGYWRVVGAYGHNSAANYQRFGTSERYLPASFGSFNTQSYLLDNTGSTQGQGLTFQQYTSGSRASLQVAAIYDETLQTPRIFTSISGRMGLFRGYFLTTGVSNNYRYVNVAVTKFGYTTAYINTSTTPQTATAYVWNTTNYSVPQATLTTGIGNGWITTYPTGKISWQNHGLTVDAVYTVSGIPDDVKFYLALDDNEGNVFYLNNGQGLSIVTADTGLYRSEDAYSIPNGYSLKVRADTENSLATLLTITEKV